MKVLQAAARALEQGPPAVLVTVIGMNGSTPRSAGARMLVYGDGNIVGTVGGGHYEYRLVKLALESLRLGRPQRDQVHLTRDLGMCCGGAMEAFIEPLQPRPQLIIHGAGHVGQATARLAAWTGFAVTVVDERDELLEAERFPPEVTLLEGDPRRLLPRLPQGPRAYHLVVTHNHQLDQDLVEQLLPMDLAWLGLIGSRSKLARFFLRLRAGGMDPALFRRLSGPVGLDIGAETPEEIAVSILAELVRVERGARRPPVPLSELPIEARGGDGRAVPPAWSSADEEG